MANPQVFVGTGDDRIDLFAEGFVINIPPVIEKKTFRKDRLITNQFVIQVNNISNFFSADNSRSGFSNWTYKPIEIVGSNTITIFKGIVISVPRNHENKTAQLICKNTLFEFRKESISYESSSFETASEAFINICSNVGFTDYNEQAVQASTAALTNNSKLKVNFNTSDNVNFQHAIEKLGEYSNSDVYVHNNEIYFVHWTEYSGTPFITLDATSIERDEKLKTLPIVVENESEIINDYSIGYFGDGGTPATDSNSDNFGAVSRARYNVHSLPQLRSDDIDKQIYFDSKSSAVYVGNSYMKRTHRDLTTDPKPPTSADFKLFADHKNNINLTTFFNFVLPDESWTNKVFEVFEYTVDEFNDDISILAFEAV
jgi:hypothetical protein